MGPKNIEFDVAGLYKWIDNYQITRQKRNINRDFSDAVPLAEILKQHYPKLVELHNYTPKNGVSQKLVNWQTLNRKVLSKLDISLTDAMMEQLAQSAPGAIEKVLFDVKEKIESKKITEEKPNDSVYLIEGLTASVSGTVIPIKHKDGGKPMDYRVLPVEVFSKMEADLQEKDEAITILKNKLQHLENLLSIKDARINDLTHQLQQNENKSVVPSLTLIKSPKFFKKLF